MRVGSRVAEDQAHLYRRLLGGPPRGAAPEFKGDRSQWAAELIAAATAERDTEQFSWEELKRGLLSRRHCAAWWLRELSSSNDPLGARLALFWHNHFACSWRKVPGLTEFMQQNALFRAHGAGPFGVLLRAVLRDPLLLRFLDNHLNRRGRPNENLARELFELFTLGLGNYDENDVKQAARVLTGHGVSLSEYRFEILDHEPGEKRVFGKLVKDLDALVDQLLAHPACAKFLARKFWQEYVSPSVDEKLLAHIAEEWRAQQLDVSWLLARLCGLDEFYSEAARHSLIKSPVDFCVAATREHGERMRWLDLERHCSAMGQRLFDPPGVQGWEGGEAWIHTSAWFARDAFATDFAGEDARLQEQLQQAEYQLK